MQDQLEYYEARARQETKAAKTSAVPEAAFVHRRLAQAYEMLTRELRSSSPFFWKEP